MNNTYRVMVVDDEPIVREAIASLIPWEKHQISIVKTAAHAVEALDYLRDNDVELMLVDVRNFGITGKEFERRLDEVQITVNKNAIPNDPEKPFVTSGIRVGTPAATSRGLKEEDMKEIARVMGMIARDFEGNKTAAQEAVVAITKKYPIYE